MPYKEFHFDSAVFDSNNSFSGTRGVAAIGSRSRRSVELNDPLRIDKFHVRDAEIPITFQTVKGGSVITVLSYTGGATATVTYTFDFPSGYYTGTTLLAKYKSLLTATAGVPNVGAAVPVTADVTAVFNAEGHLVIGVPVTVDPVGHTFASVTIQWPLSMNYNFNQVYATPAYQMVSDPVAAVSRTSTSNYPVRLIPNYIYLHSNLMEASSYGSGNRALGGYASKTIITKIQLDPAYQRNQVMPWWNSSLVPELMYDAVGTEFNRLEFWCTDESGAELSFENVSFSLTLAVLVR